MARFAVTTSDGKNRMIEAEAALYTENFVALVNVVGDEDQDVAIFCRPREVLNLDLLEAKAEAK